jgi:hypothetical protein
MGAVVALAWCIRRANVHPSAFVDTTPESVERVLHLTVALPGRKPPI